MEDDVVIDISDIELSSFSEFKAEIDLGFGWRVYKAGRRYDGKRGHCSIISYYAVFYCTILNCIGFYLSP